LFDALSEWMGYPTYYTKYGGSPPARAGVRHATVVPYGSYRCRDGAVLLAVQTESQWRAFCEVCGHPEWEQDPRYLTPPLRREHRTELEGAIDAALGELPRAEVVRRLEAADIPFGSLNSVAEFVEHPQLSARERWREIDTPVGAIQALLPPFDLEGASPQMGDIPEVGQHTHDILTEIGFNAEEIAALRASGAV
ncbi:MAG: CoA transferase, partial [Thermomicrobiales bacterium]|nr:CoA transferase [Thermomicrobiales bacterium]